MQIVFCVDVVTCTMLYSIHEPRKQLFFVTVRWRKQRGRQAEQRHWHRQMKTKRMTNISAYEQREKDGYKNVKSEGTTDKKKKTPIEERREEKESDRDALYPIHHVMFKWLRVVTYEEHWSIRLRSEEWAHTCLSRAFADSVGVWEVHRHLKHLNQLKHLQCSEVSLHWILIHQLTKSVHESKQTPRIYAQYWFLEVVITKRRN